MTAHVHDEVAVGNDLDAAIANVDDAATRFRLERAVALARMSGVRFSSTVITHRGHIAFVDPGYVTRKIRDLFPGTDNLLWLPGSSAEYGLLVRCLGCGDLVGRYS